ncbi:MAG: diphthine synthase [Candidatus Bathyarchaeota archaeon]|nr:diphthine synthase [Candidatus Bathyarchaeota archaeon]MCX8177465.1 diphthine synthase [Candidatus Bathyarchaeota archaeon]MDW8194132.1 diphthine synthase [Nitrososphaerota archaeon]
MGELVFVGLGLYDDRDISLRGLEEVKSADDVFLELYTNFLPGFSLERFAEICGKVPRAVSRTELEENGGKIILDAAKQGKAVLLVPGDPFVATTHVALRLEAAKHGVKTRIIHGSSIVSAVSGISGLHNYKFGRSVTIPFQENYSELPYEVISQNQALGLHTLCFLDINVEQRRFLSVSEALKMLLKIEEKKKKGVVTCDAIAIGIARAGSPNQTVKADYVRVLLKHDFGAPPYSIIFPGKLHFMEAEALMYFAGAPADIRRLVE